MLGVRLPPAFLPTQRLAEVCGHLARERQTVGCRLLDLREQLLKRGATSSQEKSARRYKSLETMDLAHS